MRRLVFILTALAGLVSVSSSALTIKWEEVSDSSVYAIAKSDSNAKHPVQEEGVDIFARNGYIYVVTDHEIPVRVVSILGQLIGEGRLRPGIYRMPIKSRGIYIIKAGLATVRVTL